MPPEVWDWFWSLLIMAVILVFICSRHFFLNGLVIIVGALRGSRKELREAQRLLLQREDEIERLHVELAQAKREVLIERSRSRLAVEPPEGTPEWGTPR